MVEPRGSLSVSMGQLDSAHPAANRVFHVSWSRLRPARALEGRRRRPVFGGSHRRLIRPTADDKGIAEIGEDSKLTIDVGGASPVHLEVRGSDGAPQLTGRVGDHDATDEDLRTALATHLPAILRQTGLGAESRINRIIEREGIPGVLAEIGRLTGDSARLKYSQILVGDHELTTEDRAQLLSVTASNLESDWAVSELLTSDASAWLEDPALLQPLVATLARWTHAYAAEACGAVDECDDKPGRPRRWSGRGAGHRVRRHFSEIANMPDQLRTPAIAQGLQVASRRIRHGRAARPAARVRDVGARGPRCRPPPASSPTPTWPRSSTRCPPIRWPTPTCARPSSPRPAASPRTPTSQR
jgi:hypothetical protein